MANYLVVNNTRSYELKTSHSSTPYLKVNTNYLDLTTDTTSGVQINMLINGRTYRPKQTYNTISTKSSTYTSTSGYTGISSKQSKYTSTTRIYYYSATSTSTFTSQYIQYRSSDKYCEVTSYNTQQGYYASYHKATFITSYYTRADPTYQFNTNAEYSLSSSTTGRYWQTWNPITSNTSRFGIFASRYTESRTTNTSILGIGYVANSATMTYTIGSMTKAHFFQSWTKSGGYNYYRSTISAIAYTKTTTNTIYNMSGKTYYLSGTYTDSTYTINSNSNWRSIEYYTNSYTRSSTYKSSSTTIANLSSTTALTKQTTRQSNYNTVTEL